MAAKRPLESPAALPGAHERTAELTLTPLGAGQEVGRSCCVLTFAGKTVMFDAGIHPGFSGLVALPFFDDVDLSAVDVCLVTHFHLDHCASLPYLLQKTNFKGRVFMTHATKAVYRLMLTDYLKVSRGNPEDALYDERDLVASLEKIETIDFHQERDVGGIRFWCYVAGHVLGACMFMVDIAGTRVLYTGDYSREEDRHLQAAELPAVAPDVLVVEATYGIQSHQPRLAREARFTELVAGTVLRGGKCLIPVFALGRAQELLLILDEYWAAHPEVRHAPIYYASPLARKCMSVYQTYINSMNTHIQSAFRERGNPWEFKHISYLSGGIEAIDDHGPVVVMASPGMLQSGLSRQLFDAWCTDALNACVIPGYAVEGTLAKHIMTEPKDVQRLNGETVPLRMSVAYISFSAHADYTQTSQFVQALDPPHVVLVHGEATEMQRLRGALSHKLNAEANAAAAAAAPASGGAAGEASAPPKANVLAPRNCQTVTLNFKTEKLARAVGRLARGGAGYELLAKEGDDAADDPTVREGDAVAGVLVQRGFQHQLIDASELPTYTRLGSASVAQVQHLHLSRPFRVLAERVSAMYRGTRVMEHGSVFVVGGGGDDDESAAAAAKQEPTADGDDGKAGSGALEQGTVEVRHVAKGKATMSWISDPVSDMLADSVAAVNLRLACDPNPALGPPGDDGPSTEAEAKAKAAEEEKLAASKMDEERAFLELLRSVFGDAEPEGGGGAVVVRRDGASVSADVATASVRVVSGDATDAAAELLRTQVETAVRRLVRILRPLDVACC